MFYSLPPEINTRNYHYYFNLKLCADQANVMIIAALIALASLTLVLVLILQIKKIEKSNSLILVLIDRPALSRLLHVLLVLTVLLIFAAIHSSMEYLDRLSFALKIVNRNY